jgi:hypothetical protein
LGALRRRPQQDIEEREDFEGGEEIVADPKPSYPRWAVVSGLVLYCALFWGIIAAAGLWGVEWVRSAAAALH